MSERDALTNADIEQLRADYDNHDADPYEGWRDWSWYGVAGMLLDTLAATQVSEPIDVVRLAEIVSDSLAATTEGTDWAEAPEPSDEPGSPYVLRLTNEIAARLSEAPTQGEGET